MPAPLSNDLRERMLKSMTDDGLSCRATAKRYRVSVSAAIRLKKHFTLCGTHKPKKFGGWKRHKLSDFDKDIRCFLDGYPDMTLLELQQCLYQKGVSVSDMSIHRYLRHIGFTLKKRRCMQRNKIVRTSNTNENNGRNTKLE